MQTASSIIWTRIADSISYGSRPRGGAANVLDYDSAASDFELQSRNYVYFRTNTPEKDMNPLIPPTMG